MAGRQGDSAALRRAVVSNMARRVAKQRTAPATGTVRKLGIREPGPPIPGAGGPLWDKYWWASRDANQDLYSRTVQVHEGPRPKLDYAAGNWSTPSGAVVATSRYEDEARKPVYSNRKKRPPLR